MSPKEFRESPCNLVYELDTSICYVQRKINHDHVYEIFGEFSGTDTEAVKLSMLDEITTNYDWYESRSRVILNFTNHDLAGWLEHHLNGKCSHADEISLYALRHLYDRHTVVLNKNRPWCTIRWTGDPNESNFPKSCQVHLLYIGINMFTPLKSRPDPLPQYIQNYQKASDANWSRLQDEHYAEHYMESEYSDYIEVVGGKPGYATGTKHNHPISFTDTIASALISRILDPEDDTPEVFATPGQVMFPEPTITVQYTGTATTSNNGMNISNNSNSGITIINPADTVNSLTSEMLPVTPPILPIETDEGNPVNDTNSITIPQVSTTINPDPDVGVTADPAVGVTTDPSNLAIVSPDTDAGTTMVNTDINSLPILPLKRECFVSVKKLDEETIVKVTVQCNVSTK